MSKGFNRVFLKIDGVIYKAKDNCWLKMTDIKRGEDRRVSFEFDVTPYKYNTAKAREEINNYWNSYKDSWDFMGNTYNNSHAIGEMTMAVCRYTNSEYQNWKIIPDVRENAVHKFIHKWTDREGKEHSYYNDFYIVWHQGHIYWMTYYHYLPQCQLYKFEGTNKEPNEFIKWTHVKNLKVVWNKTAQKYA